MFANIGPSGSKSQGAKVRDSLLLPTSFTHYMCTRLELSLLALAKSIPTMFTPGLVMLPSSRRISSIRRFFTQLFGPLTDTSTSFIHEQDPAYRTTIDNFVHSQKLLQQVSNPSGTVSTGGLGEPKFNIDMSPFTGGWGRPQRGKNFLYSPHLHFLILTYVDGPALRATALITYANWLIENSNTTFVTNTLWPIIKLDLDYSEKYWNQTGCVFLSYWSIYR